MSSFQPDLPPLLQGSVAPLALVETSGLMLPPANIIKSTNSFDIQISFEQHGGLWPSIGSGEWRLVAFFEGKGTGVRTQFTTPAPVAFVASDPYTYNATINVPGGSLVVDVHDVIVVITYYAGGVTPGAFCGMSDEISLQVIQ
jgi:hypothetical protein